MGVLISWDTVARNCIRVTGVKANIKIKIIKILSNHLSDVLQLNVNPKNIWSKFLLQEVLVRTSANYSL